MEVQFISQVAKSSASLLSEGKKHLPLMRTSDSLMGLASFAGQWFLHVLNHYRNNKISHFRSISYSRVPPFRGNLLKIKIQWFFMQPLALPIKYNII